ncbi:hypothetical protein ABT294_27050 [Nonomuraea sp. NPDC000554]
MALEELTALVAPDHDVDAAGIDRTRYGNVRGVVRLPTRAQPRLPSAHG